MDNRMNNLSDEVKAKLDNCKTEEEKKVLADAGIEPIDDELLDEVAGGFIRDDNNKGGQSKRPDPRHIIIPGSVEKL
ncbi:MAG: hypothetical protein K6F44_07260 [Lachnospiraceae bacterium]|nr:hypothetical protein [Lachnospiraceae bacterium]